MIPLHWLGTILSEEKALQYLASLVAQLVKNLPAMWQTWVRSLGLGRSRGEGKGYPLQYSGLENSMDSVGLQRVGHD